MECDGRGSRHVPLLHDQAVRPGLLGVAADFERHVVGALREPAGALNSRAPAFSRLTPLTTTAVDPHDRLRVDPLGPEGHDLPPASRTFGVTSNPRAGPAGAKSFAYADTLNVALDAAVGLAALHSERLRCRGARRLAGVQRSCPIAAASVIPDGP